MAKMLRKAAFRRRMAGENAPIRQVESLLREGRLAEADACCRAGYAEVVEVLGPDHPAAVELRLRAAVIAEADERPLDVLRDRHLADDCARIFGPVSVPAGTAWLLAVHALPHAGETDAAAAVYRHAVATLASSAELRGIVMGLHGAMRQILADQGRTDEAAELGVRLVEYARRETWSLETFAAESNHVAVLAQLGAYTEAAAAGFALLPPATGLAAGREQATGTAALRTNLAFALLGLGRAAEAEEHARWAAEVFTALFGPQRSPARHARSNRAWALAELGRGAEAEAECRAVLADLDAAQGRHEVEQFTIRINLGKALAAQGRIDEAVAELGEAYNHARTCQGPASWRTVRAAVELAAALGQGGRQAEAREVLARTVADAAVVDTEVGDGGRTAEHPWVGIARARLAAPSVLPGE